MHKGLQVVVVTMYVATFLLVTGITVLAVRGVFADNLPQVSIDSPADHSQFHEGDRIAVESTSTDPNGITQVRLSVDGALVRTDSSLSPQQSFKVFQTWQATAGNHTISVQAIDKDNNQSDPVLISVSVAPTSVTCTNDSAFIADVMPKNGSILAPGQSFDQVWRVQNNGTCAWGGGYQIGFTGGSRLGAPAVIDVPVTLSGLNADLRVMMKAPAQPGEYTGHWRLHSPGGAVFGTDLEVTIQVRAQRAGSCSGNPVISSFNADPMTIIAGQSSTLTWGLVSNADFASVDPGIGGVATPGSRSVSPPATTIYTLTARCGSQTTTAQVMITVLP